MTQKKSKIFTPKKLKCCLMWKNHSPHTITSPSQRCSPHLLYAQNLENHATTRVAGQNYIQIFGHHEIIELQDKSTRWWIACHDVGWSFMLACKHRERKLTIILVGALSLWGFDLCFFLNVISCFYFDLWMWLSYYRSVS